MNIGGFWPDLAEFRAPARVGTAQAKINRMKTMSHVTAILAMAGLVVLAPGCADNDPPPPPPGVAVIGFAPDYCFWDGYEYVGWYGGTYYYWGPRRVWILCDPVRVRRVDVWVKSHPNQPIPASPKVQPQPPPPVPPRLAPGQPPRPVRPPHVRHGRELDD